MRRRTWAVPLAMAALLGGWAAQAAPPDQQGPSCAPMTDRMPLEGRSSPYDSVAVTVGEGTAKICYGRPSLRGRTMIGGDAAPFGELWRTGANEPTTIHVDVAARIAGIVVEPGSYSLYTIPRADGPWTLIVNASTSQWGHEGSYTDAVQAREVGRAPVEAETLTDPVEQLTLRPMEDGAGVLLEWQGVRVHIPITPG